MATKIVTKNSSTASAVPTAAQLVQGELAVNVADKRLFTEDNGGSIVELGTNPSALTVTGEITANGGIALGDNDKATFGAGDDLQIYHDGFNSYIKESGAGSLLIDATNTYFRNAAGTKDYAWMVDGGAVSLFYNNANKLATTSTGIDVTGTATMDGLTVDGDAVVQSLQPRFILKETDVTDQNTRLRNTAGDFQIQTINDAFTVASNRLTLDHATGDISFYEDTGTTPKLFWDASAESLGIGTSSLDANLTIDGFNTFPEMSFKAGNQSSRKLTVGMDSSTEHYISAVGSETQLLFKTQDTEAMRIDSSGNLLVGTTDSTVFNQSTGSGIVLNENGQFQLASTSTPAYLNRQGSDGAIADFRKNGTTVGSIGNSGVNLMIGKSDTGLGFSSSADAVFPINTSTGNNRSSAIDLGAPTAKFKDLYLSGGVYLGGTGAANKLDDYEEGTWTPVYSPQTGSFTTLAMDTPSASYTKIGNTVILRAFIRTDDVDITGASGALRVAGLPFSVNKYQAVATSYALGGNWTNSISSGYADTGGFIVLLKAGELTATPQDMISGTNANKNSLMLEVSYETTA